jgi:AcrR family transcriptional regulator
LQVAVPDLAGARVERVLDAAGELLVRWGYQRVTIDEVARHAGIGKGTVYLHFHTKDALFLTVLLRAQAGVAERIAQRAEEEPASALPSSIGRAMYLELSADPVLRALYLADVEILGRLAHEAAETLGQLTTRRDQVLNEHLRLLQNAGCLRADLSLPALRYTFDAVAAGFFLIDGFGSQPALPVEERGELLAGALTATVEVPQPPAAELARVAPTVAALYRSLLEHIDNEWRRRLR